MTETANVPHPMQPLVKDSKGVVRFKANQIVQHLLDTHPICDLNNLACMNFSEEDRQQFAQLLGYSLGGYGDLSYVSDENYAAAFIAKVKLDNEPVTDLKQGTKIKIKEGNPQAGCTGIIVGKASMYNPVNGVSYVIQPDKPIESWPYSTFVLFECQFDVIDASLNQIKDSQSSASPAPPAEGEMAELVRWLRENAEDERQMSEATTRASLMLDRTAELLEQAMPVPVPVAERPWEREGWCDEQGHCWFGNPGNSSGSVSPRWVLRRPTERLSQEVHCLPSNTLLNPARFTPTNRQ